MEWVHPDGKRTLDKLWETQRISTAYDDHRRYRDPDRPKKRWKPSDRHKDRNTSTASRTPVPNSIEGEQLNGSIKAAFTGKRKREDDENDEARNAEGDDPNNTLLATVPGNTGAIQPAPSDAAPVTEQAPSVNLTFYLHHPSLPSRHPVLIPLPPDAQLATSLTNRIVLEFPTIYVLHNQPDGKMPAGYVSEEDFFASAKKELVEEIAGEESAVGGFGGDIEGEKADDVEDGEVDEGRLLDVLGKDLKDIAGSL